MRIEHERTVRSRVRMSVAPVNPTGQQNIRLDWDRDIWKRRFEFDNKAKFVKNN